MTSITSSSVALSAATAIAAGLVGAFALMRRMTLAADALSHVALPGIGLAILLRVNPLAGAVVTLVAGAILVWTLEGETGLSTETVTGVVFSAALALGALLSTGDQLMEALFGAPGALAPWELAAGLTASGLIITFMLLARHRLVVMFVSSDVARTIGVDVRRLSLVYLIAFALTVALGLRYLGALLMGSLIIIPAATARHLAGGLRSMLVLSATTALAAMLVGIWLAARWSLPTGPVVVAAATTCFFAALIVRRVRG